MKKLLYSLTLLIGLIVLLFYFNIIWKSPSYYKTVKSREYEAPIMDMGTYMDSLINVHSRPYAYTITSQKKGKVIVLGVEHINDPKAPQFDLIKNQWEEHKPSVALVEGRLGFFCKWLHNSIEQYGESGLTAELAKSDGIKLYTWEPSRDDEIAMLIKKYPAQKLAMFYSLRPFFGIPLNERANNPEDKLQDLIEERTKRKHLKNTLKSWEEVDSIWQSDFPEKDWRTFDSGYGYPSYLHDIWNDSNLARDKHMVNIIVELVEKGETVFVTMGSSHAPRIENTLKSVIK
ncbi:hypothetical protein [Hanstruepera marina]|uniref:hypothetical protein n=1 Tax=Hanstruepera marina TaxID=2873265 RepID=UPI001CA779EE|nr:hypothetical protein [Hanstruepera marina]